MGDAPASATAPSRTASQRRRLLVFLLIGAAVSLSLGVYSKVHDPSGQALLSWFFTGSINLKVWFATAAFALAIGQLIGGLWIYGKLPGKPRPPSWVRPGHRAAGTLAFLFTIPVAYHCLWSLGFQTGSGTRVIVHGLAGCFFFGALTAKVLMVRKGVRPSWVLPVTGGAVFTALTVIWLTSALWFFTTVDFPGI
jgi:hypothetical protein